MAQVFRRRSNTIARASLAVAGLLAMGAGLLGYALTRSAYATRVIGAATKTKDRFHWLRPPASLGAVTVADVAGTTTPHDHEEKVRAWAEAAWSAWTEHHATIRAWAPG